MSVVKGGSELKGRRLKISYSARITDNDTLFTPLLRHTPSHNEIQLCRSRKSVPRSFFLSEKNLVGPIDLRKSGANSVISTRRFSFAL